MHRVPGRTVCKKGESSLRRLADALTLIRLVCSPALFALPTDGAAFWMLPALAAASLAAGSQFAVRRGERSCRM